MATIFGKPYAGIPGRVMGLPVSNYISSIDSWRGWGTPDSWFTAPAGEGQPFATETERSLARAYAIMYEMMPYLTGTSQWDALQWLSQQSVAPGVSENIPAQVLGSVAKAMEQAPTYIGNSGLGPVSIQQMLSKVRDVTGAGRAAATALGTAGETEGKWLEALGALQTMGSPLTRGDWQTWQNLRDVALSSAPAGLQQFAASALMPQAVAPQIRAPYRASLGGWWR